MIDCKFEMVTLRWTNYISVDDTPTRGRSLVILVQCRLVTNRLYSNNRCSSADEDCDDPSTKAVREKERRQANNVRERLVNTRSKPSRCYFLRVLPFVQNPLFASSTLLSYACPKSNKRKKKKKRSKGTRSCNYQDLDGMLTLFPTQGPYSSVTIKMFLVKDRNDTRSGERSTVLVLASQSVSF